MASSHLSNTIHICFDSVLAMDNVGMVAMFRALEASGLQEFLGCPSFIFETTLVEFFHNASVRDGLVVSTIHGKQVEISEEMFASTLKLPTEGLIDLHEVPQDDVLKARSALSYDGKPISTSCKKREMDLEFRLLSDILAKSVTIKAGSLMPLPMKDISAPPATLRESISRLIANQTRDSWKSGDAHEEVMSKINQVESVILDSLAEQNQAFRGLIKSIRQEAHNDNYVLSIALKAVHAQNAILTTYLADVRQEVKDLKAEFSKDLDDKLAVIRNDLLEFHVETQGQLASLGTNLAELIAFITKGSDDKKGKVSSSHGRGQPPDDQSRPSGGSASRSGGDGNSRRRDDRRGSSTKMGSSSGGGGSGTAGGPYKKNAEWWLYGKNQF
ncbi:mucin-2-like [Dorcoceras hygrometricum]|uniref:Mucin-2-like n=1 Tax=Dorcoceras hygrometricum TaxID=472368 RepID=A0A2Z7DC99_9LAMI|nr:mucin-2-like [Dorcoceras hygrometricum]